MLSKKYVKNRRLEKSFYKSKPMKYEQHFHTLCTLYPYYGNYDLRMRNYFMDHHQKKKKVNKQKNNL